MPIWRVRNLLNSRSLWQVNNSEFGAFPISEDFYIFVKRSLPRSGISTSQIGRFRLGTKRKTARLRSTGRFHSIGEIENYATVMSFARYTS